MIPRIAITPGEPAGIGPDLIAQLAQTHFPAELVIIANDRLLMDRARALGLPLELSPFISTDNRLSGGLKILPIDIDYGALLPGIPHSNNATYVLSTLQQAVAGCQSGLFDAVVTGPVNKAVLHTPEMPFTGHTEYLSQLTGSDSPVMLLQTRRMKVALLTTHIPLREVPDQITEDKLTRVIHILNRDLKKYFAISNPRILVCGLNPHAGENGCLGDEELKIISPTIKRLQMEGLSIRGPVPADTAFISSQLESCDVVLAMYHDQGLPVLKYAGFDHAVNITLGLPIIRTSVDHGTACELVTTGLANVGSLINAVHTAIDMVHRKCRINDEIITA